MRKILLATSLLVAFAGQAYANPFPVAFCTNVGALAKVVTQARDAGISEKHVLQIYSQEKNLTSEETLFAFDTIKAVYAPENSNISPDGFATLAEAACIKVQLSN